MTLRLHRPALAGVLLVAAPRAAWAEEPEVVEVRAEAEEPAGAAVVDVSDADPGDDLGDLLERVPGARVRRLGGLGAWTGVSLRGSSFRQVQVHLDGLPLNPDGVDAVNLSELPLGALTEVRVFKGRAPATYGATPIGGVVDLRTGDGPVRPWFAVSGGSFGSVHGRGAGGGTGRLGSAPTDGFLAVDALATRGDFAYVTDRGTPFEPSDDAVLRRDNNQRAQVAGTGRWRVGDERVRFTLLDGFVWRDEGLPGPIGTPDPTSSLSTVRNLTTTSVAVREGVTRLEGRAWHLGRWETLADGPDDGFPERHAFHTVGLSTHLASAPRSWLSIGASLSGRWERVAARRLGTDRDPVVRDRGVVGTAAELGFTPHRAITLTPSVDLRLLFPHDGRATGAVNPGLVLDARPHPRVRLTASGGGAFRPPDLTELFGDRGALQGNETLVPERAWKGDLVLGWGTAPADAWVRLDVGGFVTATRDRITWIQNAQGTVLPINLGRALLAGGEASVGWAAGPWADGSLAATLTGSWNRTDDPAQQGHRLPYVPLVQLEHRLGVGWGERVRAGWTFSLLGETYTDLANVNRQPARPLHGLWLRGRVAEGWPTLELAVHNVEDRIAVDVPRDPLSGDTGTTTVPITDFVGYPLPGLTVMATLSWTPGVGS